MEIVSRVKGIENLARIIRHHHERFDGSGYPDGLAGDQIPLDSRIISVADTFDALTSERPYRPAMSVDEAKAELQNVAGTQLDPECAGILISLLDEGKLNLSRHRAAHGHSHEAEHSHALI
jgi:polar amino acid transport system substrate-binding protein